MANFWRFSSVALLMVVFVSVPRQAQARVLFSFDMASLFYEADVVAEVEELGYTEKDWRRTGKVRIRKVHKGSLRPGEEIVVSMSTLYSYYLKRLSPRNRVRVEDTMGALMFLCKEKDSERYTPVPSGIKRIRKDDVLKYVQLGNPGPYGFFRQNPEFIKLKQGQAYTLSELRRDLRLAKKRAEQFHKAYHAEDIEALQAFVPLLPSQARLHQEANLLSRKAVLKIIEKGDKDLLSKILKIHRSRCERFVISALERAIRDPGQREQAIRQFNR